MATLEIYAGLRLIRTSDNAVARDRLGNVVLRGTTRINYYAWGEERGTTGNNQGKFGTYFRDSSTGLDYAVNRSYESQWGRFVASDPYSGAAELSSTQSWNRYSYVENDPVGYTDRLGLNRDICSDEGADTFYCQQRKSSQVVFFVTFMAGHPEYDTDTRYYGYYYWNNSPPAGTGGVGGETQAEPRETREKCEERIRQEQEVKWKQLEKNLDQQILNTSLAFAVVGAVIGGVLGLPEGPFGVVGLAGAGAVVGFITPMAGYDLLIKGFFFNRLSKETDERIKNECPPAGN